MKQIIIHTFTKTEVETLDFSRFGALFAHWPQLWGMELRQKYDSLVLLVDGYNDHSDEIYAIPEIRSYFKELHRRWPWWAFFLSNENASMAVAYLCLVDEVNCFKRDAASTCAASFDPRPLLQILKHDFGRMNFLWQIAGMSEESNDRRTDEILEIFCGAVKEEGEPS